MRATIAALLLLPPLALAHGGGLNAEGCHNNRKTGDYHCHRGSASTAAPRANFTPARARPAAERPGPYYANCDAARRAGAAPVRWGELGYGRHLDRDGDGIGCE